MTLNGSHEYVYMAAYDGKTHWDLTNELTGLGTDQILAFMLRTARTNPDAIHMIFAGSYDANMILRDVPEKDLITLKETESCDWNGWHITYRPRKFFRIRRGKKSFTLWDVWGFFQGSFVNAARQWVTDPESMKIIELGKAARSDFTPAEIEMVAHYCQAELKVFHAMMVEFKGATDALGLDLKRWDGAAAIAAKLLAQHDVRYHLHRASEDAFRYAAQCAYAGGRIELLQPGDHKTAIYHYDINSAYPSAMVHLPSLQYSYWEECVKDGCIIDQYDLAFIEFDGAELDWPEFWPFFHRASDGGISFPSRVNGCYWGPEIQAALDVFGSDPITVKKHWHFRWLVEGAESYPFSWVQERYSERLEYKRAKSMLEKPLKLGMNSLYGKLAQQVGWDPIKQRRPRYHQIEWAGWITSYTRARLFRAAAQRPQSIISFETDGIYALAPLSLPCNDHLGNWDYQRHERLTYIQSGVYFIENEDGSTIDRYRGFDKGSLTRKAILNAWKTYNQTTLQSSLSLPLTRFHTLSGSLHVHRMDQWRQWITAQRSLQLLPTGKRLHSPDCSTKWGPGKTHYTIPVQPSDYDSQVYPIAWESPEQWEVIREWISEKERSADDIIGD